MTTGFPESGAQPMVVGPLAGGALNADELITCTDPLGDQWLGEPAAVSGWDLVVPVLMRASMLSGLRRRVGRYLTACGLEECADTAELCVSELLTNVLVHVGEGTPVVLRVQVRDGVARIEVGDPDARELPIPADPTDECESGRGLRLLGALARKWGVEQGWGGKTVWCEVGG